MRLGRVLSILWRCKNTFDVKALFFDSFYLGKQFLSIFFDFFTDCPSCLAIRNHRVSIVGFELFISTEDMLFWLFYDIRKLLHPLCDNSEDSRRFREE